MVMRAAMITVVTIITIIIICSVCVLHAVVWTVSLAISAFFCSSLWLREDEPSSAPFINRVPNSSKCLITSVFAYLHTLLTSDPSSPRLIQGYILLHLTPFYVTHSSARLLAIVSLSLSSVSLSLYIYRSLSLLLYAVCLSAFCLLVYLFEPVLGLYFFTCVCVCVTAILIL